MKEETKNIQLLQPILKVDRKEAEPLLDPRDHTDQELPDPNQDDLAPLNPDLLATPDLTILVLGTTVDLGCSYPISQPTC